MNYLEINHMKKVFDGDLEVLKDISLTVKKGEVVSIIGPSGSGKSTLLRCATMLETMDGGELKYLGEAAVSEKDGKCVYDNPNIHVLKEYCRLEVDKLWDEVKRFENPHDYYVDLSKDLWQMKYELLEKFQQ